MSGDTVVFALSSDIAIPHPTLLAVLAALGIDPGLPIETVQRWIYNGPRWDRLLKTAIDLTPGTPHLIGNPRGVSS